MSKTVNKLKEARFFLEQLEKHYRETPEVVYFLSAFISSARSVTWVMRSEYHKVAGWVEWYESQKPNDSEKELLKNVTEFRNKAIKIGLSDIHYMIDFIVPPEVWNTTLKDLIENHQGEKFRTELRLVSEDEKAMPLNESEIEFKFDKAYIMADEFPDEDILEVCKSYYSVIEQLVIKCEELFAQNPRQ
jgi:hypothetical protein